MLRLVTMCLCMAAVLLSQSLAYADGGCFKADMTIDAWSRECTLQQRGSSIFLTPPWSTITPSGLPIIVGADPTAGLFMAWPRESFDRVYIYTIDKGSAQAKQSKTAKYLPSFTTLFVEMTSVGEITLQNEWPTQVVMDMSLVDAAEYEVFIFDLLPTAATYTFGINLAQ